MCNKEISVVFLSNNYMHHQTAFSDAMWKLTGGNYTFVETSENAKKRQEAGIYQAARPYVMNYWGNKKDTVDRIRTADVVIAGSAPERLVRERIRTGKLLLRYSERPLKNGLEILRYPDRLLRWNWRNPSWKPIYMLCASAYTAQDYRKFGLFKNKTYKWGYFPETKRYADLAALFAEKDPTEILWCGRFLKWKHPDDAIAVARILKSEGYSFKLRFIGTGAMESQLNQMTRAYDLEDCVQFLGRMTPEQVRTHMEKAGIYLFTSDRGEGWGAVLNESMNSGCAVVASPAAGSVPYLIEDGRNGMVYESGNVRMLCDKVRYLLDHPQEQKRLGLAAYRTIIEEWNAETAAERLVTLSEKLLFGKTSVEEYSAGPCSKAEMVDKGWFVV